MDGLIYAVCGALLATPPAVWAGLVWGRAGGPPEETTLRDAS